MTQRRDTVVIGASAGGVEALPRILGQLGPEFPASIIVVQHLSSDAQTVLAEIFARQTRLPVQWIEQGAKLQPGHVYVAPPNLHSLIIDSHLQLTAGARENHSRPSIDRLFRSAAAICGSRAIGVLLTGMLDDGVAGMRAMQQAGGFTIVQDPETAEFPELPSRALLAFAPDRVLALDSIPSMLVHLTREPVPETEAPPRVRAEARLDREEPGDPDRMKPLGPQTPLSCPDCGGPTWDLSEGNVRRYRCYLGHVATAQRIVRTSSEEIETALWSAIRALHERTMMFDELAADALRAGNPQSHQIYLARANVSRAQAETARAFMVDLTKNADLTPITP